MKNQRTLILSILAIIILCLSVVGLTFAYFAYKFVKREPLDLACSTNARENSILGCLYPKTPLQKA